MASARSVTARLLAQYFIDRSRPFVGYDTDRSHGSFTRFYQGFASPVAVDTFDGLDVVVNGFENQSGAQRDRRSGGANPGAARALDS